MEACPSRGRQNSNQGDLKKTKTRKIEKTKRRSREKRDANAVGEQREHSATSALVHSKLTRYPNARKHPSPSQAGMAAALTWAAIAVLEKGWKERERERRKDRDEGTRVGGGRGRWSVSHKATASYTNKRKVSKRASRRTCPSNKHGWQDRQARGN